MGYAWATKAIAVIDAHIPSMTDEDETVITGLSGEVDDFDAAGLAVRHCHCGMLIDGFYEYVAHLKEVIHAAAQA